MYGRGPDAQQTLRRAQILNTIPRGNEIGAGELTAAKTAALFELRGRFITIANRMVDEVWADVPVAVRSRRQLTADLLGVQKQVTKERFLNAVYAEKARLSVHTAVTNGEQRFWRLLGGRFAYVDSQIAHEMDPAKRKKNAPPVTRRYRHIPEDVQDVVTAQDVAGLKALAASRAKMLAALTDPGGLGLTATQKAIVDCCVSQTLERNRKPVFGKDERFTCRIDVDYRSVRGVDDSTEYRDELARADAKVAELLVDPGNAMYRHFLSITSPIAFGAPIRIPVVFHRRGVRRFGDTAPKIGAVSLEITSTRVIVRAIWSKPRNVEPVPYGQPATVVGVDPGIVKTASATAWAVTKLKEQAEVEQILAFTKDQARDYLRDRAVTGTDARQVSDALMFRADKFRASINTLCGRIEKLCSRIDTAYERIHADALTLKTYLALPADALIPRDQAYGCHELQQTHARFFADLERVANWKKARRKLYERISEKKKHWHGHVANQLIAHIQALRSAGHRVVVCHENYTAGASIPKEDPKYKGRRYNRMLGGASTTSSVKRLVLKLEWNGIPHLALPSYYGSSVCSRCGTLDQNARSGEKYRCRNCQAAVDADENSANIYATYLCDTATA